MSEDQYGFLFWVIGFATGWIIRSMRKEKKKLGDMTSEEIDEAFRKIKFHD